MARTLGPMALAACLVLAFASSAGAQSPPQYTPTVLKAAAPISGAYGVAFDSNDDLWIGHPERVTMLDKETGEILEAYGPDPEWGADDLVFGPDDALYHTAILNGTVGRLDPDGTHTSLNSTPMVGVNPIAFADDGRLFVGLALMADALYEFDPEGVEEPRLIAEGLGLNAFGWLDGYLYSARPFIGDVVRVDVESGEATVVADGFGLPYSADVGPDGMLYVNDNAAGQVVKVDPESGEKTVLAEFAGDNMAFDSTGRLFASSGTNGRVVEILPDGSLREVVPPGLIGPAGVAVMSAEDGGTTVYVGDIFSFHAVDGRTGADLAVPHAELFDLMSVGPFGTDVVVSSWMSGMLQVWDLATGEVVADLAPSLAGAPLDAIGFGDQVIVSELGADGPAVVSIDPATGERTILAQMGVPSGLATDGEDLWAADWAAGTVSRLTEGGATIEPVVVATDLAQPEGLALMPDGSLVVSETGAGRITHIDPASGETTPLVEGLDLGVRAAPLMPPTNILADLDVDDAGSIYASTGEGLVRYDPQS